MSAGVTPRSYQASRTWWERTTFASGPRCWTVFSRPRSPFPSSGRISPTWASVTSLLAAGPSWRDGCGALAVAFQGSAAASVRPPRARPWASEERRPPAVTRVRAVPTGANAAGDGMGGTLGPLAGLVASPGPTGRSGGACRRLGAGGEPARGDRLWRRKRPHRDCAGLSRRAGRPAATSGRGLRTPSLQGRGSRDALAEPVCTELWREPARPVGVAGVVRLVGPARPVGPVCLAPAAELPGARTQPSPSSTSW